MDAWARQYAGRAHFLCLCCQSGGAGAAEELAVTFSNRMQLRSCINGYVPTPADMPAWGQLGCAGLIVIGSGKSQPIISRATSAFQEVKDLAFRQVECILDSILVGKDPPKVMPGHRIIVKADTSEEKGRPQMIRGGRGAGGEAGICLGVMQEDNEVEVFLFRNRKRMRLPRSDVQRVGEHGLEEEEEEGGQDKEEARKRAKQQEEEEGQEETGSYCGLAKRQRSDKQNCTDGSCALPPRRSNASSSSSSSSFDDNEHVAPMKKVASVSVEEMDQEHEMCADALNALASERTVEVLQMAHDALERHFEHEEQLLEKYVYVGVSSAKATSFNADANARKNHYNDHDVMLKTIRLQIRDLEIDGGLVPASFISSLMSNFHAHADLYDGSYASRLSMALQKEEENPAKCVPCSN